jgi:hypothetical protein
MILQQYPDELHYVNAKLNPLGTRCGSFLELLLYACMRADADNYEPLRPALHYFMAKYPADERMLEAEKRDMGSGPAVA